MMGCGMYKMRKKAMEQAIPSIYLESGDNRRLPMPLVGQSVVTHEEMGAGQIQTMAEQAVAVGHRRFVSKPGEREVELGNALRNKIGDGTIYYDDIFVSSVILETDFSKLRLRKSLVETLKNLGQTYLSLLLLNSPCAIKTELQTKKFTCL